MELLNPNIANQLGQCTAVFELCISLTLHFTQFKSHGTLPIIGDVSLCEKRSQRRGEASVGAKLAVKGKKS